MKPLPFKMRQETPMEKFRAETFWTKEPETLAWIESFDPHDCFFDVGANVGIYSLYAASLFPEMHIFAFEPMLANFISLRRNRDENGFGGIYCQHAAVGNYTGNIIIRLPENQAGMSGAQIDMTAGDCGELVMGFRIDALPREHRINIKIDIDGQEIEVVKGMVKTLPFIKSILIEVSKSSKQEICGILWAAGFSHQNRFNTMIPHSRERRAAEGIDAENIIFTRPL